MDSEKDKAHSISTLTKLFKKWPLSKPATLFWFFLLVSIIPNICLAYTEPFSFMGKVVLITYPIGLYFILLSILRNIGLSLLLLFPMLFLGAFQLVLLYLFGESIIAVDMFLNLASTSANEAGELLNKLWPAIIIVCVIYIPTLIIAGIACKVKMHLLPRFRKSMILAGIAVLAISYGLTITAQNKNTETFVIHDDVYPFNVLYNLHYAVNKWERGMDYPNTSKDFRFNARKTAEPGKREIYVLVIGEASRAANWELWGYERETTPQLEKQEGVLFFRDAITQSNTTHKSVPLILSAASAKDFDVIYHQKSVISAFKEAGFKTVFLSNQPPNRTFTDYFAQEADININIRPTSVGTLYSGDTFDSELIPHFQQVVDSLPDNLFIVLHTYGSHFNYKERYPANYSYFVPDNATEIEVKNREQLINAYDNSIRYTDNLLDSLITILDSTGSCNAMYYTADHGEDLLDDSRKRFLHASPNPTYYQLHVPLLMWFSENYRTSYPDRYAAAVGNKTQPVSTDAAFHTLLEMASIETPFLDTRLSLVNPGFEKAHRMYLTDHDKPILFYRAGLKKEDEEMFRKNQLYL